MSILDKFLGSIRVNDDFDEDDEFFDDDYEEEEKPKRRFFKKLEEDEEEFDDYEEEEEEGIRSEKHSEKKASATKTEKAPRQTTASSKITPMRNRRQVSGTSMSVCVIKPTSFEESNDIIDILLERCTVVLNLEGVDMEVAQRVVDFSSGACYSLGGDVQKISSYIFILTPSNVEISGDFQEMLNGSLDMQSTRKSF